MELVGEDDNKSKFEALDEPLKLEVIGVLRLVLELFNLGEGAAVEVVGDANRLSMLFELGDFIKEDTMFALLLLVDPEPDPTFALCVM
jgi:hypothetical protein